MCLSTFAQLVSDYSTTLLNTLIRMRYLHLQFQLFTYDVMEKTTTLMAPI